MCFDTTTDRRAFLRLSSLGLATVMLSSFDVTGVALAAPGQRPKTLVKVFMRGGADGLFLFPPYADMNYYVHRRTVRISAPNGNDATSAIPLTSTHGLHPQLRALREIWDSGRLAIAPATHFSEGNLSHFDCQAWIERGTTARVLDGVFNRYLQNVPGSHELRALIAGMSTPAESMMGKVLVPSVLRSGEFGVESQLFCDSKGWDSKSRTCVGENLLNKTLATLNGAPRTGAEETTRQAQNTIAKVMDQVNRVGKGYTPNAGGLTYSTGPLGRGLELVAQLLKNNVPVEIAAVDWGNAWDSHENHMFPTTSPIDETGRYARDLRVGAEDLLCFFRDLGPLMNDVLVVVGTEFGREVIQNGTFGTDHGRGGPWFAFGGPTKGGIYGAAPSLAVDRLDRGRYVPSVVNYKDIIGEAMQRHMGVKSSMLSTLYPGHTFTDHKIFTRAA